MLSPKQILARERASSASVVDERVNTDSPLKVASRSASMKVTSTLDNAGVTSLDSSSESPTSSSARKMTTTSYKSVKGGACEGRQGILWKEVDPQVSHSITETQHRVRLNFLIPY